MDFGSRFYGSTDDVTYSDDVVNLRTQKPASSNVDALLACASELPHWQYDLRLLFHVRWKILT